MSEHLGLPGQPMRCMHCHIPEDQSQTGSCLPGYHHGFVTRRPGQSSAEAETALDLAQPLPPNDSTEQLARFISKVKHDHEKQLDRERMEAEWNTKERPTVTQGEPQGLFEQKQEELFEGEQAWS